MFLVYLTRDARRQTLFERMFQPTFQPRYKLGLLYLRDALRSSGYDCRIFDQSIERFDLDDLVNVCQREQPRAVGFYTWYGLRAEIGRALARLTRELPTLPLICGGPGSLDEAHHLSHGCRAVVHGEGERTLPELVHAITANRPLAEVQGIGYLDASGQVVRTPERPLIDDLDSLGFPEISGELLARSRSLTLLDHEPQIQLMASRGCPFNCAYCECPGLWRRQYRRFSVEAVVSQIDRAVSRFGVRTVSFLDDVFAWDRGWLESFTGAMRGRHSVRFDCNAHPLSFHWDPEGAIDALADAGLKCLNLGIQSLEPRVQRLIHRSPREADAAARLIAAARRRNVLIQVNFILGLPGESPESLDRIQAFLRRTRPNVAVPFRLMHLPGSELTRNPEPQPGAMPEREIQRIMRRIVLGHHLDPRTIAINARFLLGNSAWGSRPSA